MPTVAELNAAAPDTPVLRPLPLQPGPAQPGRRRGARAHAPEPAARGRPLRVRRRRRRDPPRRAEPGHPVHDDRASCRSSRPRIRSIRRGTSSASSTASASRAWSTRAAAATPTRRTTRRRRRSRAKPASRSASRTTSSRRRPGRSCRTTRRGPPGEARASITAIDRLDGCVIEGAGENLVWSAGDFENFLAPRPELGGEDGGRARGGDTHCSPSTSGPSASTRPTTSRSPACSTSSNRCSGRRATRPAGASTTRRPSRPRTSPASRRWAAASRSRTGWRSRASIFAERYGTRRPRVRTAAPRDCSTPASRSAPAPTPPASAATTRGSRSTGW